MNRPTAGQAIARSLARFQDVHGAMALAMERGRPVARETLQMWSRRLKEAATELEEVTK